MVRSQSVVPCLLQGSFFSDVPYAQTHLACMPFHHQPGYPSPTFVLTIRISPQVSQDGSRLKGRCWEYLTVDVNVMRGHGFIWNWWQSQQKTKGIFFVYEKICLVGGMIPTSSWCVCIPLKVWVGVFPYKVIYTNHQGKIWWVVVNSMARNFPPFFSIKRLFIQHWPSKPSPHASEGQGVINNINSYRLQVSLTKKKWLPSPYWSASTPIANIVLAMFGWLRRWWSWWWYAFKEPLAQFLMFATHGTGWIDLGALGRSELFSCANRRNWRNLVKDDFFTMEICSRPRVLRMFQAWCHSHKMPGWICLEAKFLKGLRSGRASESNGGELLVRR